MTDTDSHGPFTAAMQPYSPTSSPRTRDLPPDTGANCSGKRSSGTCTHAHSTARCSVASNAAASEGCGARDVVAMSPLALPSAQSVARSVAADAAAALAASRSSNPN